MTLKKLVGLMFVLMFMSIGQAFAQDDAETQSLDENGIQLEYPLDWSYIVDPNGTIVLSNADIESIAAGGEIPEGAVFMQVIVAGVNIVPFPEVPEVIDAESIMSVLIPPEAQLEVTLLERDDAAPLAVVDQSTETDDGLVYLSLLDDQTFGLFVTTASGGVLEAQTSSILAIIDTVSVDLGVTLEDGVAERYADFEQSTSEEGYPQVGNIDAPVTVVEISSFDCPACRFFHDEILPAILERVEAGEVLFQYVSVYGTGGIPGGQAAAAAAFCAGEQNAFWSYHDIIFGWQDFGQLAFNGTRLRNGADALELDLEEFDECLASERPTVFLDATLEYAFALEDFAGTPTIFVNGEKVNNSAEAILALIDEKVAEAE